MRSQRQSIIRGGFSRDRSAPGPAVECLEAIFKARSEDAKKIHPGFEDTRKFYAAGDSFGDLIIWKELIEKASPTRWIIS